MASDYIKVGDYGTVITLDVGYDINTATLVKILYKKPTGTSGSWTGTVSGNDNDRVSYTLKSGDIDVSGDWELQAYVKTPLGEWRGDVVSVPITKKLD